jgi:ribosomal protein S17E
MSLAEDDGPWNDPEPATGPYDTKLNSQQELAFRAWKQKYYPNDSGEDYDLRGAFLVNAVPGPDGHGTDRFKKPNHPTFSAESQYASPQAASSEEDGPWNDGKQPSYYETPLGKALDVDGMLEGESFLIPGDTPGVTPVYGTGTGLAPEGSPDFKSGQFEYGRTGSLLGDIFQGFGEKFESNRRALAGEFNVTKQALNRIAGGETPIAQQQAEEEARRFSESRPFYEAPSLGEALGEGAGALTGSLVGGASDPFNFVGGIGKTAASTFGQNAVAGGVSDILAQIFGLGRNTEYDPASEQLNAEGDGYDVTGPNYVPRGYSPEQTAISALTAGTLPVILAGQSRKAVTELGQGAASAGRGVKNAYSQFSSAMSKFLRSRRAPAQGATPDPVDALREAFQSPEIDQIFLANNIPVGDPRRVEMADKFAAGWTQAVDAPPSEPLSDRINRKLQAGQERRGNVPQNQTGPNIVELEVRLRNAEERLASLPPKGRNASAQHRDRATRAVERAKRALADAQTRQTPAAMAAEITREAETRRIADSDIASGETNPGFDPRAGGAPREPLPDVIALGQRGERGTRAQDAPVGDIGRGAQAGMEDLGYADITPEQKAALKAAWGVVPETVETRRRAWSALSAEQERNRVPNETLRTSHDPTNLGIDKNGNPIGAGRIVDANGNETIAASSPISRPQESATRDLESFGAAENERGRYQPTEDELRGSAGMTAYEKTTFEEGLRARGATAEEIAKISRGEYSRTSAGNSDRPFKADEAFTPNQRFAEDFARAAGDAREEFLFKEFNRLGDIERRQKTAWETAEANLKKDPRNPGKMRTRRAAFHAFKDAMDERNKVHSEFLIEQTKGLFRRHGFRAQDAKDTAQRAEYETKARDRAEKVRREVLDDLLDDWKRAREKRERDANERARYDRRQSDAREQYGNKKSSNTAKPLDADGRFEVDERGFVLSDKGTPILFADQNQTGRWILNAQKQSVDQNFEIHNHPTASGFTARETSRTSKQESRGGTYGESAPGSERRDRTSQTDEPPRQESKAGARPSPDEPPRGLASPKTATRDAGRRSGPGDDTAGGGKQSRPDDPKPRSAVKSDGDDPEPSSSAFNETDGKGYTESAEERISEADAAVEEGGLAPDGRSTDEGMPDESVLREADKDGGTDAPPPRTGGPTKLHSNPFFDPEILGPIIKAELDAAKQDLDKLIAALKGAKGKGPHTELSAGQHAAIDLFHTIFSSNRGKLFVLRDRYKKLKNEEAHKILSEITDHLATDPGSGRAISTPFVWAIARRTAAVLDRFSRILDPIPTKDLEAFGSAFAQGRKLSGPGDAVAPRLRKALDELQAWAKNELTAAAKERKARAKTPEERAAADEDLNSTIGYVKDFFPRILNDDLVRADPEGFVKAATQAYRTGLNLSQQEAEIAARSWLNHELGANVGDYTAQSVSPSTFKGRLLPASADKIMDKFYVRNPHEVFEQYVGRVVRFVEFTKRFGKHGEKLEAQLRDLQKAGVSAAEVADLRETIRSSTGQMGMAASTTLGSAVSTMQTVGMLRLLPRQLLSSLVEPLAYGARTGNLVDGLRGMRDTVRQIFGKDGSMAEQRAFAEMWGIWTDAAGDALMAARSFGSLGQGNFLSVPFTGDKVPGVNKTAFGINIPGTTRRVPGTGWAITNKYMQARFQRANGIHIYNGWSRIAGVKLMRYAIADMINSLEVTGRKESARVFLADVGIGKREVDLLKKHFALESPPVTLMGSEAENILADAIYRMVGESIQQATPVDVPRFANHPVARMAYSLTRFSYAFGRNMIYRSMKAAQRAITNPDEAGKMHPLGGGPMTPSERVQHAAGPLLGLLTLATGQFLLRDLRDQIGNPEGRKRRDPVLTLLMDVSGSGVLGATDPYVNAILGVRYTRTLTGLLAGAYGDAYLSDLATVAGLLPQSLGGANSPDTDTAEWNTAKAIYSAVGIPAMSAGLSLLPGGPILKMAYGGVIASPIGPLTAGAARSYADSVVGEQPVRGEGAAPSVRGGRGNSGRRDYKARKNGRKVSSFSFPSLVSSANAAEQPAGGATSAPRKRKYVISRDANGNMLASSGSSTYSIRKENGKTVIEEK